MGGCRPEPLSSYLKALGILRLVADQADASATGHWADDVFVLGTTLDWQELLGFLLDHYRPTPVVSPWNSSSGFGKEGEGELRAIEASADPRLEPYRRTISVARRLLDRREVRGWDKPTMVAACRSELPDEAIPWVDAAVVLTVDGVEYPPVLGTGGNDGRLEFSRNFHRRLIEALGLAPTGRRGVSDNRRGWLEDSLTGSSTTPAIRGESPGQFDPGGAGGVNSSPVGQGEKLVNPWDFVLLIEGTVLFASAASRRLATGARGKAAMPFMVSASNIGFASAAAESTRGELWAPLWAAAAGEAEVARLFAEGRAEWCGHRAGSGLDLVKAAASLGVDRGIDSFARHVFVERFGLSTIAVAAGRTTVTSRPEVAPLAELDPWVERVRRGANPPTSVTAALRALDGAAFALAQGGGSDTAVAVLVAAARLELAVARSTAFRSRDTNRLGPIQGLKASTWVPALLAAGNVSAELRLALALASGRDAAPSGRTVASLRFLLRPLAAADGSPEWAESAVIPGLGSRATAAVLAAAHARRVLEVESVARRSEDPAGGVATSYQHARPALLADVIAFARGELDDGLLADLVAGMLLLDWRSPWTGLLAVGERPVLEPALCVLGPFFCQAAPGRPRLVPEASWPAQLALGRTADVISSALRRLRIAGLRPGRLDASRVAATAPPGPRLAAALLCPLGMASNAILLDAVTSASGSDPDTDPQEDDSAQP